MWLNKGYIRSVFVYLYSMPIRTILERNHGCVMAHSSVAFGVRRSLTTRTELWLCNTAYRRQGAVLSSIKPEASKLTRPFASLIFKGAHINSVTLLIVFRIHELWSLNHTPLNSFFSNALAHSHRNKLTYTFYSVVQFIPFLHGRKN